jgi:hypothetical protein
VLDQQIAEPGKGLQDKAMMTHRKKKGSATWYIQLTNVQRVQQLNSL